MTVIPPSTDADARNRAVRTFVQGLLLDVLAVLAVTMASAFADVQWTKQYWYGIAALLAKTLVQTVVSYVARKVLPPAVR